MLIILFLNLLLYEKIVDTAQREGEMKIKMFCEQNTEASFGRRIRILRFDTSDL